MPKFIAKIIRDDASDFKLIDGQDVNIRNAKDLTGATLVGGDLLLLDDINVSSSDTDGTEDSTGKVTLTQVKAFTDQTKADFDLNHLFTLVGAASDTADNLATFTGSTIADNQTIKQALQALETAVETKQASGNYITGTGSLSAQDLTDIGNLSGTNTGDNTVMSSDNSYAAGLVLAGSATHNDTYLRKDGTWSTPIDTDTDTNTNQLTTFTLRDNDNDDFTISHGKFLKVVSATGAAGTNIAGSGTTGDPIVLTITNPDTTYSAGNDGLVPSTGTSGHFLAHNGAFAQVAYSNLSGTPTIPTNYVTNDADDTMEGTLTIDKNSTAVNSTSTYGQKIDLDHTGNTAAGQTINNYGLDIDIDYTGNNLTGGNTNSFGINIAIDSALGTHSGASGVDNTAIKAVLTGDTDTGNTTQIGYDLTITGGDTSTQTGFLINTDNGSTDLKIVSSTDTSDYCTISTTANGETTIATEDNGGESANLILNADGDITLDCHTGKDIRIRENGGTYTPTADSNVATKKYVDDNVSAEYVYLSDIIYIDAGVAGRTYFRDADDLYGDRLHEFDAVDTEDSTTLEATMSSMWTTNTGGLIVPFNSTLTQVQWQVYSMNNFDNEVNFQTWVSDGIPDATTGATTETLTLKQTATKSNYKRKHATILTTGSLATLGQGSIIYPAIRIESFTTSFKWVGRVAYLLEKV